MASVGIINDYSEVVVAISHLITPGHEVGRFTFPHDLDELASMERPAVIVAVIFRHPHAFDRPIEDFDQDVSGGPLLRKLSANPAFQGRPLIIFGIGVSSSDVPDEVHYHSYLTFPQAIQELSPLISALVGPAPQDDGAKNPRPAPDT